MTATPLDLRGLRCPLPVLRLEAALRRAREGDAFRVVTDDPIATVDIPHAMKTAGHDCDRLASDRENECVFHVTKTLFE